jgi:peroxiredoxin
VDLQSHYQEFQTRETEVIALAVQSVANAGRMVQVTGARFPILADPDHAVADAYQVYDLLGDGVAAPAIFIINPSGDIIWSYIGRNSNDRPSSQIILDQLPPP